MELKLLEIWGKRGGICVVRKGLQGDWGEKIKA